MAYKTILVHVENNHASRGRLAAAAQLARDFQAHLVGIGIQVPLPLPAYAGPTIAPIFIPAYDDSGDEELVAARAIFDETLAQEGRLESPEWRTAVGDAAHVLDMHSRYADFVVIGQTDYDNTPSNLWDVPDNLVVESTRPVMVMPKVGPRSTLGKTIAIAWDGGRPAARAVHAALPLLVRAEEVQVLTVDRPARSDQNWQGADLCSYLTRHGANATLSRFDGSDHSIDDVLLNGMPDAGVDLIVMGAYGHSRFRQTVLGGTTRNILQNTTLPVVMDH